MRIFQRPRIVASRCVEFDHCRWNGDMIGSNVVRALKGYAEFVPVCPEVEIGLGVPRKPVRLVASGEGVRLVQPESGMDVTERMRAFSDRYLDAIGDIDGFILKSRSPSCGTKDVRIYRSPETAQVAEKGRGLFAEAVFSRFPDMPIEDEGRLRNRQIREYFLTRLFTLAEFRQVQTSERIRDLQAFHARNKFLLMAYNQGELEHLGRIVANPDRKAFAEVVQDYRAHLIAALHHPPRYTATINALMHAFGHFSDELTPDEKTLFLDTLERYRQDRVTICPNLTILRSWIARFGDEYLGEQTFFTPFPPDLVEVAPDLSHEGREYREVAPEG
ncbi:DUF1722 domain-containing protein [Methanofollis fontis]|uniref:DUF1722 domain-containing protein n=1 Tax=Methanofollis fontis TaxID=2052832 RepID=A0A483CWE4_9EURY|nr:DUF1722 domain-containing protein [Methanofollis fontis]